MKLAILLGTGCLALVTEVSAHDGLSVTSGLHWLVHLAPNPLLAVLLAAAVVLLAHGFSRRSK